jgi:hypothetical protein
MFIGFGFEPALIVDLCFFPLLKKDDDEEEKKENQFFAGGLDNRGGGSGLAVQAPPTGGGRPIVGGGGGGEHDMLHRIIERGMQDSHAPPPPSGGGGSGQGVETIEITLYRNGFTVNNGPFRDLTAPENQRFLASLQRGEVPDGKLIDSFFFLLFTLSNLLF